MRGFLKQLLRVAPKTRGIREALWHRDTDEWSLNETYIASLREVAAANLVLDLLVNRTQLQAVARLATALPELRMNINHLGYPNVSAQTFDHAWEADLRKLAKCANVYVKLSGLPQAYGGRDWTAATFEPYIRATLGAFGPERVNFAGNWFVLEKFGLYPAMLKAVQLSLSNLLSSEGVRLVMVETATRLYRLGEMNRDGKLGSKLEIGSAPTVRADPPADCGGSWDDCDCRTWGDNATVLSWHIHYTTNSTDMRRFYSEFVTAFSSLFDPNAITTHTCPFGPNYGLAYPHVCSLEEPYTLAEQKSIYGGSPWGDNPQRAFYIPVEHKDELWAWAQLHRGYSDVLKHPNTGCMHDDHSTRAEWVPGISRSPTDHPTISTLEFPCNMRGTGCNDTIFSGPPSCGCSTPLSDDAPWDSCNNCHLEY